MHSRKTEDAAVSHEQAPFLLLNICPTAYTFSELLRKTRVWDAPEANLIGVYLYCIDYEGKYLVNYVGKAGGQGGFAQRLRTDDRNDCAGRYWSPVEVDAWKRGVRIMLSDRMTPEYLERYLREMRPLIRLLLLPLPSNEVARRVENTLVCRLHDHPAAFQFLSNRDHHRRRIPVIFADTSPQVIGLNAPVRPCPA